MIKRIARKIFSKLPFFRKVYHLIGLGYKVNAIERTVAYYDIRIDKIYKKTIDLIDRNNLIAAENVKLNSDIKAIDESHNRLLELIKYPEEVIWEENKNNESKTPEKKELLKIFENIEDPFHHGYAVTHHKRWLNTFELLSENFKEKIPHVVELGAAPFYNKKLKDILAFDKITYVGKPFLNSDNGILENFVDFNLEEEPWPIETNSVDAFLAFELIEHLFEDPMAFFVEANRCLRKEGKLVITTPNIASWKSIKALMTHYSPNFYVKFFPGMPLWYSHRTEYSVRDIREFARAAGFDVDIKTFNSYSEDNASKLNSIFDEMNVSTTDRGDTIWAVLTKISEPIDRYPEWFYQAYESTYMNKK